MKLVKTNNITKNAYEIIDIESELKEVIDYVKSINVKNFSSLSVLDLKINLISLKVANLVVGKLSEDTNEIMGLPVVIVKADMLKDIDPTITDDIYVTLYDSKDESGADIKIYTYI